MPDAPDKPEVVTFGCRLNLVESEFIRTFAGQGREKGVVIVNTCAVTAEATRQARQAIRRIAREQPQARIVVTGCAAQIAPQTFSAMPEVAHVMGNAEKTMATSWDHFFARENVGSIARARRGNAPAPALAAIEGHTRAFLAVQNGCDHSCTFCIIPQGRGPSRSVGEDDVLDQARRFVASGHKELVLTGVDLTSWGSDLPGAPKSGGWCGGCCANCRNCRVSGCRRSIASRPTPILSPPSPMKTDWRPICTCRCNRATISSSSA